MSSSNKPKKHHHRGTMSPPSPSPGSDRGGRWLNWQSQSVSDISMSDMDLPMEYSESEDDAGAISASPRYATGSSAVRPNSQLSPSSRIVRFHGSDSEPEQQQPKEEDETSSQRSKNKSRRSQHSRGHRKQNQKHHHVWNAVSNLAHSVSRSPAATRTPTRAKEFNPLASSSSKSATSGHSRNLSSEQSPLLTGKKNGKTESPRETTPKTRRPSIREDRALEIAASFLQDCEAGRRPSLPADLSTISDTLLTLRKCKFSIVWELMVYSAGFALFISSCLEARSMGAAFGLNVFSIVVFVIDMAMGSELRKHQYSSSLSDPVLTLRHSRMEQWTMPLMVMLLLLAMEMVLTLGDSTPLWSGALKPIAFFYISNKAKNALEALNRIGRIVVRVLVMELFLILCFGTVACQLYNNYDSFHDLSTSWLSLFQLSTTVVNPSMWMPMYSVSRSSAFFFVLFVITSVFYLHSLVLSVVFQTYVQASADIHDRSMSDWEDSMRLAFLSLESIPTSEEEQPRQAQVIEMDEVRKALKLLRPHYSDMKINALVEIIDPGDEKFIDYPSFRTKMRQAMNASIRSTRTASAFSIIVELMASVVAVTNAVYVILVSSDFQADWFDAITFPLGCVITVLGAFELIARIGHVKLFQFTPITRLNGTFDGLAALAAVISLQGIFNYLTGRSHGYELLFIGRAVDMIRFMRFFGIFRDVVRRSEDVFPALAGPLTLVLSAVHIFTYLGMALWINAIVVGSYGDKIETNYDLNNFNSYVEGLVAMFQVLVVNDWHAIALVFLYASRCSSPYIVYPFFIGANLVCVSIMLNCLTAFFVGAFVTKLSQDVQATAGEILTSAAYNVPPALSLAHSGHPVDRIASQRNVRDFLDDEDTSAVTTSLHEFDVYEREGYDKIMRTVAGGNNDDDEFARQVCDCLEVFESLCSRRDKVGYMVCCQQTLNRYGNRRFQSIARNYVHENALHMVVSDMHAELLLFPSRDRILQREFPHLADANKKLEITASLIRQQPAMSLFVSRTVHL